MFLENWVEEISFTHEESTVWCNLQNDHAFILKACLSFMLGAWFASPLFPVTACRANLNFIFLNWKWACILTFPGSMVFFNDFAWEVKASLGKNGKVKKKPNNQQKKIFVSCILENLNVLLLRITSFFF